MRETTKKILYNFGGTVLPMAFGILVIPHLLDELGSVKFGLLSIGWMIVGYFGILDMGIGRSLTQKISENLGKGKVETISFLTKISMLVVGLFGVVGALIIWSASEYICTNLLKVGNQLINESILAFRIIAITVPVVLMSTVLFGALDGLQLFKLTSLIRAPLNALMFLAPAVASMYSNQLEWIFGSLLVTRIFILIALIAVTNMKVGLFVSSVIDWEDLKCVFKSGGWVTVSNIISPMMVYFDRFYIPYALGIGLVAYYTTPLDVLLKALLIPASIMGVLFTKFAQEWQGNKKFVMQSYKWALLFIFIAMLPIPLIAFFYGGDILNLWLGEYFSAHASTILFILSVGIFFNGLGVVPFFLLQGVGRADLSAKVHVIELPIYLLALFFLTKEYSLNGVALAWSMRVFLDFVLQASLTVNVFKK